MNLLIFERNVFDKLYNCSMLSQENWESYKNPNKLLGSIYITIGAVYQTLYIPFLIIMLKRKFFRYSAYKIMFYLGIIDVSSTVYACTLSGLWLIRGDIFCTNPMFLYIAGCFTDPLWIGASITGFILMFSRIVDLMSPKSWTILFDGNKTFFWLMIPSGFILGCVFFAPPFIFNSYSGCSLLNPYWGVDEVAKMIDFHQYDNLIAFANDVFLLVTYPVLYTTLPIVIYVKSKMSNGKTVLSKLQKQIILQSIINSGLFLTTGILSTYLSYFPTPEFFTTLAMMTYQASHGCSVFAYIFVNKSMRRAVLKIFQNLVGIKTTNSSVQFVGAIKVNNFVLS